MPGSSGSASNKIRLCRTGHRGGSACSTSCKLPGHTLSQDYGLEYGRDRLEIHADARPAGARVIVVDDVLATGGTLNAALALVERQGARIVGTGVLVELGFLEARTGWTHPAPLHACAIY